MTATLMMRIYDYYYILSYHQHVSPTCTAMSNLIIICSIFFISRYPLILSIENHCSIPQQQVMAQIMKDTFGKQLYMDNVDMANQVLPSPEELKNKILVKVSTISDVLFRSQTKHSLSVRKLFRRATLVTRLITLHTLVMYRV